MHLAHLIFWNLLYVYIWLIGDISSNIINKNGSTIRFNDLRRKLVKNLKETDLQELKDSLEGKYMYKKILNCKNRKPWTNTGTPRGAQRLT